MVDHLGMGRSFRFPMSGDTAGGLVFDTSLVATEDRLSYWSAVGSALYGDLAFSRYMSQSFAGRISVHKIGALTMLRTDATPIAATRSLKVARASEEGFNLRLHLYGRSNLAVGDYQVALHPGELLLTDNQASFHHDCSGPDAWANLSVTIPFWIVHPYVDRLREMIGVPMSGENGAGGIVRRFLVDLAGTVRHDPLGEEGSYVAQSVLDLILGLCLHSGSIYSDGQALRHDVMLRQVKDYIEERLGDNRLHPATIARDHFISIRLLYKLFEREGSSPMRWIQSRRLERCQRELADSALADESIAQIAYRCGFPNPAHFSRLFRARTGVSPREFRQYRR